MLLNFPHTMHNPAYHVWDIEKQNVYDVAAPAFDEAAPSGWWRAPLNAGAGADADYKEPLVFPAAPAPPADTNASDFLTQWVLVRFIDF